MSLRHRGVRSVSLGRQMSHASHKLYVYRGVFYCANCGAYATVKARKLAVQCTIRTTAGQRNLTLLGSGELPVNLLQWPSAAAETIELCCNDGPPAAPGGPAGFTT